MTPLPIDEALPELLDALASRGAAVLVAEPGAGKTTRVPPAILRMLRDEPGCPAMLLLQPRRVAARAAAARIAAENGWTVGREIGYQVRFDRKVSRETRITVITEGILTRRLLADPFLEGVGAVILDEFHERSLHTDLALALLKEVKDTVRDDLRLLVMSATLDPGPISRFLGDCPVIQAPGRSFPVSVEYAPATPGPVALRVAQAVISAVEVGPPGDVLVFLPGVAEIQRTARELASWATREDCRVLPLHGRLSAEEQARALDPAPVRKVILSTNVAETSLTIEGVTTVIDSGLARFAAHDPARGLDRLELGRISKASASQRAGRAGRLGPGRCVRLWSAGEERGMAEFDTPEVHRVDLAETVLALRAWGHPEPAKFPWFEPPPTAHLEGAQRLLFWLGATEAEDGPLTPIGQRLLRVPAHPRLGRLLLAAADQGIPRLGATLAALLTEKDLLAHRGEAPAPGPSDLLPRLDALNEAESRHFSPNLRDQGIDPVAARQVARARDDLLRSTRLGRPGVPEAEVDEETLLRLTLLAYPDRVARLRGETPGSGVMVGGRGIQRERSSIVRESPLILALDPRDDRRGGSSVARVSLASEVRPEWLEAAFPGSVARGRSVRFDERRGRVVGLDTWTYRGLVLREDDHAAVDPDRAGEAIAAALVPIARAFLREEPAIASFLDRLESLRQWCPEREWPALDDVDLAEILTSACRGKVSIEEVRGGGLLDWILGWVGHSTLRLVNELTPEALVVPSGNRIRLVYESGRPPILAVRLQELFGCPETPRIADGRVAVLLHLLGPNFRPVQVTDDLQSFWASTYFQVRKDLRARYPRHSWPDAPLLARPEAKGSRRRD